MSAAPRFTQLQQWLDWQLQLHPRSIDLGLDRVREVAGRLDLLAPNAQVITVGGTNGKGSVATYLESLLQAAGKRVGCFTSPHFLHYGERIRLDGAPVADEAIVRAFDAIDRARGDISLTYFEFGTLAAVWLMDQAQVDCMVLEVGLGGRLDACNLWDADVAIVSSIGLDHQQYLGNTRESVAREKAGIFRLGRPALCGDRQPPQTLLECARSVAAEFERIGQDFNALSQAGEEQWLYQHADDGLCWRLAVPGIPGPCQQDNAALALRALHKLGLLIPLGEIGASRALADARLVGRCQRWPGRPQVVLDVAHNPQAAEVLAGWLDRQPPRQRVAVAAMLADKDHAAVLAGLAGQFDAWYLPELDVDRAGSPRQLAEHLQDQLVRRQGASVAECLRQALANNPECDIVVFGSFHTVAEAMLWLQDNQPSGS